MARYRRYRKYTRRGRSAKWSANIQEIGTTTVTVPAESGAWAYDYTLAFNPTQVNTAVSQIYTVKNFEVTFEFSCVNYNPSIEDITCYIMFVPQGMQVTPNYNNQHPEYILAYKFLGSPYVENGNSTAQQLNGGSAPITKVRTRLSRKLNTGDSIILFLKGNHTTTTTSAVNCELHGLARWWTKAN